MTPNVEGEGPCTDASAAIEGPMTDAEMDEAIAAYKALPGTPPDGWSFIPEAEIKERTWDAYRDHMDPWRDAGMKHARLTRVDENGPGPAGVWIEVWKERPHKEAEFFPPLTASPPADGALEAPRPDGNPTPGLSKS